MLDNLWDYYKYDKWNYSLVIKDNKKYHHFFPKNKKSIEEDR